jgi:hypothetical protein
MRRAGYERWYEPLLLSNQIDFAIEKIQDLQCLNLSGVGPHRDLPDFELLAHVENTSALHLLRLPARALLQKFWLALLCQGDLLSDQLCYGVLGALFETFPESVVCLPMIVVDVAPP